MRIVYIAILVCIGLTVTDIYSYGQINYIPNTIVSVIAGIVFDFIIEDSKKS